MAYPTVNSEEKRGAPDTTSPLAAQRERLRAGLMLVALLSVAALFWVAVIRLVTMA